MELHLGTLCHITGIDAMTAGASLITAIGLCNDINLYILCIRRASWEPWILPPQRTRIEGQSKEPSYYGSITEKYSSGDMDVDLRIEQRTAIRERVYRYCVAQPLFGHQQGNWNSRGYYDICEGFPPRCHM